MPVTVSYKVYAETAEQAVELAGSSVVSNLLPLHCFHGLEWSNWKQQYMDLVVRW